MNLLAYADLLHDDSVYTKPQGPEAAVTAPDPSDPRPAALCTARLLEQLLQIARTSALEEMASGVAHELNQPMGAIATFAQTAERMLGRPEPMVAEAHDILHHISNEALKAGDGIRRIRSLFAAQSVTAVECRLGDVVAELQPVLELLAARAGATLEIQLAADLPPVAIDRLRIQHVLFTLVQNAFEAPCQPGDPQNVRIEVGGDGYGVVTTVSNRGVGISAAARDNLFKPFFTTKTSGTGLGLASSRAIVEAHEGTIGHDDAVGGGARFWFRLPAAVR